MIISTWKDVLAHALVWLRSTKSLKSVQQKCLFLSLLVADFSLRFFCRWCCWFCSPFFVRSTPDCLSSWIECKHFGHRFRKTISTVFLSRSKVLENRARSVAELTQQCKTVVSWDGKSELNSIFFSMTVYHNKYIFGIWI